MTNARVVRATRDLPVNALIRSGDVLDAEIDAALPGVSLANAESLHGTYVRSAKRAGDAFAPGDVNASPLLPAKATLMSIGLKSAQALAGLLTVDMRMDVYGTAKAADGKPSPPDRLVKDVRVVAVVKDPGVADGSGVIVIFELPPASDATGPQEAGLKLAGATDLSVTIRS